MDDLIEINVTTFSGKKYNIMFDPFDDQSLYNIILDSLLREKIIKHFNYNFYLIPDTINMKIEIHSINEIIDVIVSDNINNFTLYIQEDERDGYYFLNE